MNYKQLQAAYAAASQEMWDGSAESGNPGESFVITAGQKTIAFIADNEDDGPAGQDSANRDFICLAHSMMPSLLDAVKLLQRLNQVKDQGDYFAVCDEATALLSKLDALPEPEPEM